MRNTGTFLHPLIWLISQACQSDRLHDPADILLMFQSCSIFCWAGSLCSLPPPARAKGDILLRASLPLIRCTTFKALFYCHWIKMNHLDVVNLLLFELWDVCVWGTAVGNAIRHLAVDRGRRRKSKRSPAIDGVWRRKAGGGGKSESGRMLTVKGLSEVGVAVALCFSRKTNLLSESFRCAMKESGWCVRN